MGEGLQHDKDCALNSNYFENHAWEYKCTCKRTQLMNQPDNEVITNITLNAVLSDEDMEKLHNLMAQNKASALAAAELAEALKKTRCAECGLKFETIDSEFCDTCLSIIQVYEKHQPTITHGQRIKAVLDAAVSHYELWAKPRPLSQEHPCKCEVCEAVQAMKGGE